MHEDFVLFEALDVLSYLDQFGCEQCVVTMPACLVVLSAKVCFSVSKYNAIRVQYGQDVQFANVEQTFQFRVVFCVGKGLQK